MPRLIIGRVSDIQNPFEAYLRVPKVEIPRRSLRDKLYGNFYPPRLTDRTFRINDLDYSQSAIAKIGNWINQEPVTLEPTDMIRW